MTLRRAGNARGAPPDDPLFFDLMRSWEPMQGESRAPSVDGVRAIARAEDKLARRSPHWGEDVIPGDRCLVAQLSAFNQPTEGSK